MESLEPRVATLCAAAHDGGVSCSDLLATVARLYPCPPARVLCFGDVRVDVPPALEELLRTSSPYFDNLLAPGRFAEGEQVLVEMAGVAALERNAAHVPALFACLQGCTGQDVPALCALTELAHFLQLGDVERYAADELKARPAEALADPGFAKLPWPLARDLLALAGSPVVLLRAAGAWAHGKCPCGEGELLDHVQRHFDGARLSVLQAESLAQADCLRWVSLKAFFGELVKELRKLIHLVTECQTCHVCGLKMSVIELNTEACMEGYHPGTHQSMAPKAGTKGWSCCDAGRLRDPGCQRRYVGPHSFPLAYAPSEFLILKDFSNNLF